VPHVTRADVLHSALPPGEIVRSRHQFTLAPEARQVRPARRFVLDHVPALHADECDTLALLTSELVTNAVIHPRTEIIVAVVVTDHYVLVSVHDLDLGRAELDPGSREGGWGLGLVASLADAAARLVHPDGGKTAWFRLRRSATADG